jgi:SNF2 family DNA or RNA helicase
MHDLVAMYLDEKKVTYLRFQGNMSRKDRDAAVEKFNHNPKYKVLLMSLKCGGQSANLKLRFLARADGYLSKALVSL